MAQRKNRWQAAVSAATAIGGLLLASANAHAQTDGAAEGPTLTVGSKAPTLDVAHWVQDGGGKFKPVTEFKPGNVYVVEFWATWCGPCVASMPHLASMQQEYADKGVQVVSISDEDLETVEKFLDREVPEGPDAEDDANPEKKAKTFRELTSAYCLTTDPDRSVSQDYMEAAQENGIPTAFLVGKDGKVEWIGHPMELDEPLKAVVSGSWDREAFSKELAARKASELALRSVFALLQRQDFDGALEKLNESLATSDNLQLKMLKLQILIAAGKTELAEEWSGSLFDSLREKPDAVNMIGWSIYQMAAGGALEKGPLIDTAVRAVDEATKTASKELQASVLDTLARLQFVNGDIDKAIATQRQAIQAAKPEEREMLQEFLKEAEDAKSQKEKADK